jgi:hypothetical protein
MPTYSVAPGVLSCRAGDDEVLLDTASGDYYRLETTGAWIWRHLVRAEDVGDVVAGLFEACDENAPELSVVQREVSELLDDLLRRGLLLRASP